MRPSGGKSLLRHDLQSLPTDRRKPSAFRQTALVTYQRWHPFECIRFFESERTELGSRQLTPCLEPTKPSRQHQIQFAAITAFSDTA